MSFEKIQQAAIEYYGDSAKANAFIEGMYKAASLNLGVVGYDKDEATNPITGGHLLGEATSGLAGAVGKGAGGLVADLATRGLGALLGSANRTIQRTQFLKALDKAIETNRILKGADRSKVMSYAETIFKYAPSVATDANFLSSVLAGAVHGEGIDARTIEMLVGMEGKHGMNGRNMLAR